MPKNYPDTIDYYGQTIPFCAFISLKPQFKAERKAMRLLHERSEPNAYIRDEQRGDYRIVFDEYVAVFQDTGELVGEGFNEEYNFVLTCDQPPQLLIDKNLHHSTLANGKKVLAAGSLMFTQGVLVGISNNSGHYRPSDDEMLNVIKALHVASYKHLKQYKSYVSTPAKEYAVEELVMVDHFSDARPLDKDEILLENGKRQGISGYEIDSQDNSSHRFGKNLSSKLQKQYQETIAACCFFQPVPAEKKSTLSMDFSII